MTAKGKPGAYDGDPGLDEDNVTVHSNTSAKKFNSSKVKRYIAGYLRLRVAEFTIRFCPHSNYFSRLHDRLLVVEEG